VEATNAAADFHTARVIAFPGRPRGELVRIKADLEEMKRILSVR
jgi:hypothetical protein